MESDSKITDLLQICLPAQLAYIAVARDAADTVAAQLELSADSRSALKLAIGEACNNAVQYFRPEGTTTSLEQLHSSSDDRRIYVACRVYSNVLEVDVVSEGNGFQPTPGAYLMPAAEEMAENGRGLALIELLMDSVEYQSTEEHFRVRLRKHF